MAYLTNELKQLPCQLEFPMHSAILAFFNNDCEKTVAFRSDMDALPVEENKCVLSKQTQGNHARMRT